MTRATRIVVAAALFVALAIVCLVMNVRRIEADILDRSTIALNDAGLTGVNVIISGRDVLLTGGAGPVDSAYEIVAPLRGIRRTAVIATADATPPTTSSSVSAPTSVSTSTAVLEPTSPSAPSSAAVAAPPPRAEEVDERIRTLVEDRPIRFATGSAELLAESRRTLDELARLLSGSDFLVSIEGHTDATGSAQRNLTLSQQRAEAVLAYLASRGVSADRMTAIGVGAARPVAPNSTPAGRQRNRRIEFHVTSPN